MDELLADLIRTSQATAQLGSLAGRTVGRSLGIVTDRADPIGHGRIKATVAAKGGNHSTDWLTREEPCSGLSLPVPQVGETVWVGYTEGDPHKGHYSGVVQNQINPAGDPDSLRLQIGTVLVEIRGTGEVVITGANEISLEAPQISLIGDLTIAAGSVSINGSQVATVGALDNRGDTLTSKGW